MNNSTIDAIIPFLKSYVNVVNKGITEVRKAKIEFDHVNDRYRSVPELYVNETFVEAADGKIYIIKM